MTHPECDCCTAIRDELVAVHMMGRLKARFDGWRMDDLCEWLGLPLMGISWTSIEGIFEALDAKVHPT